MLHCRLLISSFQVGQLWRGVGGLPQEDERWQVCVGWLLREEKGGGHCCERLVGEGWGVMVHPTALDVAPIL